MISKGDKMIKNLKKLRNEKNISQLALANIIGISQQSINKYENHSIEPDISTLIAIADYFGVSIDYLVGRTDDPTTITTTLHLNQKEVLLLNGYRSLTETEQTCINVLIATYNKECKKQL